MSLPTIKRIKVKERHSGLQTITGNEEVLLDVKSEISNVETEKSKCGEIFALQSGNFILICGFCGAKFENMELFGEHVRGKHRDDICQPDVPGVVTPPDPISISICIPIIEKTDLSIPRDDFSQVESQQSQNEQGEESLEKNGCDRKTFETGFWCVCNGSCSSKKSLRQHTKNECKQSTESTGDPNLFCRICNKQMTTRYSFKLHQQLKHPEAEPKAKPKDPSLFCELCSRFFKSKQNFYSHVKRVHDHVLPLALQKDPDSLKCKFCNQQCSSFSEKKEHELTHSTEESPYICSHCPKVFATNAMRSRHIKRHLNIRDYSCEVCGNAFITKRDLEIHMTRHTGNRPFICEECGLTFPVKSHLKYHQKRHAAPQDFQCNICEKWFYSFASLKEHQIGHTDEQPFVCDVCGRCFSRKKAHKKHMKLHSDVKKYVCNICGKAYAQDSGLYAHKKWHSKLKV